MASCVLLAALLAVAPLSAQSRIRTSVDTTLITIGDRVTMTVTVDHPPGTTVAWPDSVGVAPFEALGARASAPAAQAGALRSTALITMTVFEIGDLEIPSFDVAVVGPDGATETLSTDRFGIEVLSVGADESGDIRDIRGPLTIAIDLLPILLLGLLVLGLITGALWWWRRRSRGGEDAVVAGPPLRPAHEIALEALSTLEASSLLQEGQVKEYHVEASDIVRRYVEGRFGVPALEMTTQEVVAGLERARVETQAWVDLKAFLDPCDMVKFAKVRPDAAASRAVLDLGRRFVEGTIPRPGPVTIEEDDAEAPHPPDGDDRAPAFEGDDTDAGPTIPVPGERVSAAEAT